VHKSLQRSDGDRAAGVYDGGARVVPATAVLARADPKPVESVGTPRDSPDDGGGH
jgi:hypothetical protein